MTDRLDLPPRYREQLEALLREHVPGVEVWAYGSRVNGKGHQASDLDLVLRGPGLAPLGESFFDLLEAIENSNIPILVQAHDWARLPQTFHSEVERDHVVLQEIGPKPTPADAWRRYDVSVLIAEKALAIGDGYRAKNTELSKAGIPFARAGNIRDGFHFSGADCLPLGELHKVGEKISRPGDTVFTSKGTVGRFAFVRDDTPQFVYSPQLSYWRAIDTNVIEPGFLYCWMTSREFFAQFKSVAGQTDMAEYVSLTDQRRMHMTLPPLPEQRAIAHVLGTLDDKIELNRRMNETLEEMARALFKSWFVDFEPVRAKMEGRWRRGESLPGLPAEHYDLFPDRLVPSELGDIPEGWEVKRIEDVAERVAMGPFGSSIKVSTFVNSGIPIISGQHLKGTLLEDGDYRFVTEEHAERLAKSNVQRGDVIFTHAGNIGQVAYIPETSQYERYVISQRQFYLRCDVSQISPLFVVHYFKTRDGQHQLLANTSSTGVPSIARPVTHLRSIQLCVPSLALWMTFHDIARGCQLAVGQNTAERRTLAAQRDALLPRLVSGEVRV